MWLKKKNNQQSEEIPLMFVYMACWPNKAFSNSLMNCVCNALLKSTV